MYHVARCAVVILVSRYKVVVVVVIVVVVVVVFVCVVDKIIARCLFSSLQEKDASFSREKNCLFFKMHKRQMKKKEFLVLFFWFAFPMFFFRVVHLLCTHL